MYTLSIKIVFSYEYYSNTSAVENMCILAAGLKYHICATWRTDRSSRNVFNCFGKLTPLPSPLPKLVSL